MTGIIILAAGSSSRLGKPKQNLVYKGKTLLQRAIETALASICDPVIVVLGANAVVIRPSVENYKVTIVKNPEWHEGMASSIRIGIKELLKLKPDIQSVILMLCDQPFVDTYVLNHLILAKSKEGITVCSYNDTVGPPVLFDAIYFDDLLMLKGAEGAKKVIQKYPDKVVEILFPQGSVDIDTLEDYEGLI
jgi:molybdenum cofactor cytidylyltransferase